MPVNMSRVNPLSNQLVSNDCIYIQFGSSNFLSIIIFTLNVGRGIRNVRAEIKSFRSRQMRLKKYLYHP